MNSSHHWTTHFTANAKKLRIDWRIKPRITSAEKKKILKSLQAWQLGETSEGLHLIESARKYSLKINDFIYPIAVELFIKEEQKHGNNLGRYLDVIGEKRVEKDWGDWLFRKVRYFNTSMEIWTMAVITVESAAQIFYQSLNDATNCPLLKQICDDILLDEADHITFQKERMFTIFQAKNPIAKAIAFPVYTAFYFCTSALVWYGHRSVFKAGGHSLGSYFREMSVKFTQTFGKLNGPPQTVAEMEIAG